MEKQQTYHHQHHQHHQRDRKDSNIPPTIHIPSIFIPKNTVTETYPYRHKRFNIYYDFP